MKTHLALLFLLSLTMRGAGATLHIPDDWKEFHFSSEELAPGEKQAILAAELATIKKHESKKPPTGYIYRATRTKAGYDVHCEGYSTDEKGNMHFTPGRFHVVSLNGAFKVMKIMGGV